MKRALSVTAVLFALCLVLSGCSKVQHAEKLIEEIGEVTYRQRATDRSS